MCGTALLRSYLVPSAVWMCIVPFFVHACSLTTLYRVPTLSFFSLCVFSDLTSPYCKAPCPCLRPALLFYSGTLLIF